MMHLRLDAEVRLKATHALLRKHVQAKTRWYRLHWHHSIAATTIAATRAATRATTMIAAAKK